MIGFYWSKKVGRRRDVNYMVDILMIRHTGTHTQTDRHTVQSKLDGLPRLD